MKRFLWILVMLGVVGSWAVGQAPVRIIYWTHEDPNRTQLEERFIAEFQAMYPHVTIERVTYPSARIAEVVLTAFAAHRGPDIFNLEIQDAYPYLAMGRVAPLRPEWVGYDSLQAIYDAYLEGTLDAVTKDGALYGLPLELTIWVILANKKYFREVGIDPETEYPRTWEAMVTVSEKLVIREGDILKRRGFDFRYDSNIPWLLAMVEQMGGSLLSPDGKRAIIDDEAWLHVLRFLRDWGPLGKNLGAPTYTLARKLFNFDRNEVAMCLTGLYQIDRIRVDNLAFYESKEWMFFPFPVFENAVNNRACLYYGHYLMVNAESSPDTQEWAWRFIAYMLSHPVDYLTKVGLVQPRKDLLASQEYQSIPYAEVFAADMARSHMVPLHPANAQFKILLTDIVKAVMLEGVSPEEALRTLKQRANEILEETQ